MNFSKFVAALALSSISLVAGCTAETASSQAAAEPTASEHAELRSVCSGLGQAKCEATAGCMEEDTGCLVSCQANGTCTTKCNQTCAPLACNTLPANECASYSGNQCQVEKSCLVSCHPGTGCTTTCTDSCVPEQVDCTKLDQTACAANGNFCQSIPGACKVTCTVNGGCVTACGPATCGPITN